MIIAVYVHVENNNEINKERQERLRDNIIGKCQLVLDEFFQNYLIEGGDILDSYEANRVFGSFCEKHSDKVNMTEIELRDGIDQLERSLGV